MLTDLVLGANFLTRKRVNWCLKGEVVDLNAITRRETRHRLDVGEGKSIATSRRWWAVPPRP